MVDAPTGANLARTVIIGNSGAGKSWLAGQLAARHQCPSFDLDQAVWDGTPDRRTAREPEAARRITAEAAAGPRWIIEGLHAPLAAAALRRATALIWLDVPWSECRAGLIARGPRPGLDADAFARYLAWAGTYWYRDDPFSFAAHERLFARFHGAKLRLLSRDEAAALLTARPAAR